MSHDVFLFLLSTIAPKVAARFTFASRNFPAEVQVLRRLEMWNELATKTKTYDRFKNVRIKTII